ncbi:MAG: hypothetical protein MZU95_05645 [Desulfomicrobium escambiense]|nr:hypothetical protein [Desulfomicrobium escambiense]
MEANTAAGCRHGPVSRTSAMPERAVPAQMAYDGGGTADVHAPEAVATQFPVFRLPSP